ncbi:AfsR/SARP family transcriptional regulator [Deinococcus cellulosilyticus]|uniref:Bacterial transcriptional activator domain-containing protein n=1 Tax=Deinococcus cellulosilyticus (strain DSM 18568 / NBRC 106333 / KACC 11606 / 5516J-15) TaxID=1223518 RepID=A0A511MZP8_DEIC1|nr:BTAD domain-containing putative transcriptional regulator [Deinococcus cellulosilyticus]GEM46029.1 hypothetical protein DC3_16640 [Deinococcus cellulosilyticus NBRC 106333 = KACC 11606]
MPDIQVKLMGSYTIVPNSCTPESRKAQCLLAYVILNADRQLEREAVAAALWGESPTEIRRGYLRKALHQVNKVIPGLLESQGERLVFQHPLSCDIDVWEMKWLYQQPINEENYLKVKTHLNHVQGELLSGWEDEWCWFERERHHHLWLSLLEKTLGYALQAGLAEDALMFGTRILHLEPAHEPTHQALIQVHLMRSDRAGAIRQYQRCKAALQEWDLDPDAETLRLYEEARGQREAPRDVLSRLTDLYQHMLKLQEDTQQQLRQIERLIRP